MTCTQGGSLVCLFAILALWSLPNVSFAQQQIEISCTCSNTSVAPSCLTLNEMLANVTSNTTLLLESCVHTIESYFLVINKTDLRLEGNPADPSSVVIKCDEFHGLIFMGIVRLTISGLTVHNCSFKGIENVTHTFSHLKNIITLFYEPLSDFSTGIFMAHVSDLVMEDVVIDQNEGFGMVGINIIGDSKFLNVNFTGNSPNECVLDLADAARPGGTGGAAFLLYQDYNESVFVPENKSTLLIDNAFIEKNYNCRLDLFAQQHDLLSRSLEPTLIQNNSFIGAGGITLSLAQAHYAVYVNITNSIFRRNSGTFHGAGLEISHFELTSDSHVFVTDTIFTDNGNIAEIYNTSNAVLNPAGALLAAFYLPVPRRFFDTDVLSEIIMQLVSSVEVINCSFYENVATSGAGIQVFSFGPTVSGIQDRVVIKDCQFERNVADYGSAVFITEISYSAFEPGLMVVLDSITAAHNHKPNISAISFQTSATGVIDINFINVTLLGTNQLFSNGDTAISVYSGILVVTGTTNITENIGINGGGLSLDTESYLVLSGERAEIWFNRNRALVNGGGIYVNFNTIRTNEAEYDCFLFFDYVDIFCDIFNRCSQPRGRFRLFFVNNTAQFGEAIFGSSFSTCPWINDTSGFTQLTNNSTLSVVDNSTLPIFFYPPFAKYSSGRTINTVASIIRVDHAADLQDTPRLDENSTIHVFPGQHFLVPLGTLDRLGQPVPLTIFSQLDTEPGNEAHSQIGGSNRFLISGGDSNFTDIPLHIFAEQNSSYVMTIASGEALVNITVRVFLNFCPPGFNFDDIEHGCVCNITGQLVPEATCNSDGTINHEPGYWVGVDVNFRYIQSECIFDYCDHDLTVLNLEEPDSQCRDHRSGVLCGKCKEGFSRMIGTNACGVCDSYWNLFYILLFAVLGILLFAYLAVFNVTITDGYLNGFIFYSNIIDVYLTFYVPSLPNTARIVPAVIISFLSLNFGIPICFYPGMTQLDLAFLRFLFPIYLMVILIIVVLCGKYISKPIVAKIFQKINVTHIFATLILLSYASFIRASFTVLTYTPIDGAVEPIRWMSDPNILYSDPLHVALVFLSIFFLLIFIPFPLLLLFPRLIFRMPVLRNLKPLVDAFIAPLAPKREFWVGLRMMFRLVFFLISLLPLSNTVLVVHAVLLTILTVIESRLQPFNSNMKNLVNRILVTNMTIFSITAIASSNGAAIELNVIALYIFLIMFILLNLHYILIRFKWTRDPYKKVAKYIEQKFNRLVLKISSAGSGQKKNQGSELESSTTTEDITTHTSIDFSRPQDNFEGTEFIAFREELLEADSQTLTHAGNVTGARPTGRAL